MTGDIFLDIVSWFLSEHDRHDGEDMTIRDPYADDGQPMLYDYETEARHYAYETQMWCRHCREWKSAHGRPDYDQRFLSAPYAL